eukprot:gnl/TRDRNA2_/TRDRNA2_196958_c0_seq1.p1 gnl/TRDRNA2_/TRDRNA2_196958_c0~~gnl/TRDRNA2_/TRDRNA2_196958_c0_seq1.p1  ORF type:complete len:377 (+),score=36.89 gnl/TRDRNA2_/TRDRNA2_196958_c0_seq1:58-1188(+)
MSRLAAARRRIRALCMCEYCYQSIKEDNLEAHMRWCSANQAECPYCGLVLQSRQMELHQLHCLGRIGKCSPKARKQEKREAVQDQDDEISKCLAWDARRCLHCWVDVPASGFEEQASICSWSQHCCPECGIWVQARKFEAHKQHCVGRARRRAGGPHKLTRCALVAHEPRSSALSDLEAPEDTACGPWLLLDPRKVRRPRRKSQRGSGSGDETPIAHVESDFSTCSPSSTPSISSTASSPIKSTKQKMLSSASLPALLSPPCWPPRPSELSFEDNEREGSVSPAHSTRQPLHRHRRLAPSLLQRPASPASAVATACNETSPLHPKCRASIPTASRRFEPDECSNDDQIVLVGHSVPLSPRRNRPTLQKSHSNLTCP